MASLQEKVQQRLDKATSEPQGPAGVVFGAVDRSGKVLTTAASGFEELGNKDRPMKTDSVFCLYSCTKMIAGIACMQLVEQGKVKLDDPVEGILPEIGAARFSDGRAPKNKITLRHLLSHTAGFGYTFFHDDVKKWSEQNGGIDEFSGSIEGFKSPLIAEPGEDWHYSVGIDWAGELLHRLTGQTLGEYCKKNIFDPLGATDIGFGVQPQHKGRLVSMHQRDPSGTLRVREHLKFIKNGSSFDSGGAGCVGTIEDYLKVMVVLLNKGVGGNGTRILKEDTLELMFQDQLENLPTKNALDVPIPAVIPELTDPVQMMPGVTKGWGLTFQILKDDLPTGRKAGSVWWAGLPNNFWAADPNTGIATMILSQSFPFNDMRVIVPWLDAETAVYQSL